MWLPIRIAYFILLSVISLKTVTESTSIHNWLVQCYRGNETEPVFPYTVQLLIEFIRKVEDANPGLSDIRTVSASLLHQLRLDGIERIPSVPESEHITPFAPNGIMNPKFQLILKIVPNAQNKLQIIESLNRMEFCQLHRMISTTVEPWKRKNEYITCSMLGPKDDNNWSSWSETHRHHKIRPVHGFNVSTLEMHEHFSKCPIEKGAIRTFDYGTFTPGTVIASIAAGLQPQSVPVNKILSRELHDSEDDTSQSIRSRHRKHGIHTSLESTDRVDNTYAANIAGDLAEICVYQTPYAAANTSIGITGYWNDTFLPRIRYLKHTYNFARWEMTDTEALGGIDGFFMSQKISEFIENGYRLKLSQVLDLFYSRKGLPLIRVESSGTLIETESTRPILDFPNSNVMHAGITNACHRSKILRMINRDKLKEETYRLAQVLQHSTSSLGITDENLRRNCDNTVKRFFKYADGLIEEPIVCANEERRTIHPAVDLTVIIDESRNEFENQQMISFLSETIDISKYGSTLSIIHGTRGALIVNQTRSVTNVFQHLHHFRDPPPTRLTLSLSMATHMEFLSQRLQYERYNRISSGLPQILIIFAQGQRLTEHDFAYAREMARLSVSRFPDLYHIFIAQDERLADELFDGLKGWDGKNHKQYHVIEEKSSRIEQIDQRLKQLLNTFPRRIVGTGCEGQYDIYKKDYTEEYLTPNEDLIYRISPYYFIGMTHGRIQFDGVSHGTFTICRSQNENFDNSKCKTINDYENAVFYLPPCEIHAECSAVFFKVSIEKSHVKCFDPSCRYPDQVRFYIRATGLRCDAGNGASPSISYSIFLLSLSVFSLYLNTP